MRHLRKILTVKAKIRYLNMFLVVFHNISSSILSLNLKLSKLKIKLISKSFEVFIQDFMALIPCIVGVPHFPFALVLFAVTNVHSLPDISIEKL